MERTEIVSLYKNTPADGTVVTVCGWAKNIRDSKNIGFIALSDGGCFKTLQVVLEAGKLENYEEVIHTGLYSSLRIVGRIVLTPQAKTIVQSKHSQIYKRRQDAIDTVVEQIVNLSFAKHSQLGHGNFQLVHFERNVISVEVAAMINILCIRIDNRIVTGGIYFVY